MTPDELRRMDNDQCIIYEKGIKPVKARKFYYFEHPMAKELARYEISHNDIGEIKRGNWRKYNPYNPYVDEKDKNKEPEDLKVVESLDDLFDDVGESNKENKEEPKVESNNNEIQNKIENKDDEDIRLPYEEDENEYDLQKELEAKFDELFGSIDEDS